MSDQTTRVNPEIDSQLLGDLKTTLKLANDGKVKGRLSPAFEEAIRLYNLSALAKNPGLPNNYHKLDEDELPEDFEGYLERMQDNAENASYSINEIAHNLRREEPGELTNLSKLLEKQKDNLERKAPSLEEEDHYTNIVYD